VLVLPMSQNAHALKIFLDVLLGWYQYFGETYCLHLHGWNAVNRQSEWVASLAEQHYCFQMIETVLTQECVCVNAYSRHCFCVHWLLETATFLRISRNGFKPPKYRIFLMFIRISSSYTKGWFTFRQTLRKVTLST
jgi:hypothetical protein